MPRYFFDIIDGQDFPDPDGSEHADITAARREAVRYSAEVLKEMPERFWGSKEWTMFVSDHQRTLLFTLEFIATDAVPAPTDAAAMPPGQAAT